MTEITKSKAYEWRLVIIFFFGWGFIFLDRMMVAFITPTLAEVLSLTFERIGNITSITNLCYAIATILFGIFAVKIKRPKKWLVVFALATAFAAAGCMFVQTYGQLLVMRGIIGALEGPISPLILVLVSRAASEKSFGLDVGLINMGVGVLAFIMGPIFAIKSVSLFGWQTAFLVVALPSIIVSAMIIFTVKEIYIEEEAAAAGQDISKASPLDLLRYRNVIITAIIAILAMSGYWAILVFGPMYMTVICGYTQESVGVVLSTIGILTMFYSVGIPWLSDVLGRKTVLAIFLIIVCIGAFVMAFFPEQRPWSVPVFAYILIGNMVGAFGPIAWNILPMESVPLHLKATSCGVVLGLAEIIGGSFSPKIGGMIADSFGLTSTFLFVAILTGLGFIMCFLLTETLPAKAKKMQSGSTANP